MQKKKNPLLIANWKQNPATLKRAEKIFVDIQKGLSNRNGQSLISVAPPNIFLADLAQLSGSQKIEFLSQDVSVFSDGAHTGEISATQLRSVGVKASIVGHSERRSEGETNEEVNQKIHRLHEMKSTAIVCVGEKTRDNLGDYFSFIEEQIRQALQNVDASNLKNIVIAYEPVWAIGTGENATPENVEEMKLFIQKVLSDLYDREKAAKVRIIYGGSVNPENAEQLLKIGNVDGFLIGGASLEAKKFVSIIKTADKYAQLA